MSTPVTAANDLEIVASRLFPYSAGQVFAAFRDPARLARWWGPNGFANTFREFDLQPGGYWRFVMHGPDGVDYPNESIFLEVQPGRKVVFDHLLDHRFRMTHDYEPMGENQTRLTWRMLHETVEDCRGVKDFVPAAIEQNFDRLAAELARVPAGSS